MKKVIDRIIKELENVSYFTESTYDEDGYSNDDGEEVVNLCKAVDIVKKVLEEYYIARQDRVNGKIIGNQQCLDKLGRLEDAEEKGLLLISSIKPGDIVFCWRHAVPTKYSYWGVERFLQTENELIPARVVSVKITKAGAFMKLALKGKCLVKDIYDGEMETREDFEYCNYVMSIGALGKTVFLIKEEAEQALKEMGKK